MARDSCSTSELIEFDNTKLCSYVEDKSWLFVNNEPDSLNVGILTVPLLDFGCFDKNKFFFQILL